MTRSLFDIGRLAVSLGLILTLGSVALGTDYHVSGTIPYPDFLPNDFDITIAIAEPPLVGDPTNSNTNDPGQVQWGPGAITHQAGGFLFRWVGPPHPALVDQPVTFGFDFTSSQPASLTDAWWTINGQRIANETEFFTLVPEPSSFALAAFSFVGLAAWAWKRRKRA